MRVAAVLHVHSCGVATVGFSITQSANGAAGRPVKQFVLRSLPAVEHAIHALAIGDEQLVRTLGNFVERRKDLNAGQAVPAFEAAVEGTIRHRAIGSLNGASHR